MGCTTYMLTGQQAKPLAPSATEIKPSLPIPQFSSEPPPINLLPKGVAPGVIGPIQGQAPEDPDSFKTLYGYSGPFYNIEDLDNRAAVITQSLYKWPTTSWKVTGLVRNQTHGLIKVTHLTAKLVGRDGSLLGLAEAKVYVDSLRAGEPGPFEATFPIGSSSVMSVEWNIFYNSAQPVTRSILFDTYENRSTQGYPRYDLGGVIRNTGTTTARGTQMVVAWIDSQNRVRYIDTPKLRLHTNLSDLKDSLDLPPGGEGDFVYTTREADVVAVVAGRSSAFWGIAR